MASTGNRNGLSFAGASVIGGNSNQHVSSSSTVSSASVLSPSAFTSNRGTTPSISRGRSVGRNPNSVSYGSVSSTDMFRLPMSQPSILLQGSDQKSTTLSTARAGLSSVLSKVSPLDVESVMRSLTGHGSPSDLSSRRNPSLSMVSSPNNGRMSRMSVQSIAGHTVPEDPQLIAVRAVMVRELHVQRLSVAARRYAAANEAYHTSSQLPSQQRQLARTLLETRNEIISLINILRNSTLDAVECISRWIEREVKARATLELNTSRTGNRRNKDLPNNRSKSPSFSYSRSVSPSSVSSPIDKSIDNTGITNENNFEQQNRPEFMWRGRNYILQLAIDTAQILVHTKVPLREWTGIDPRGNPTFAPTNVVPTIDYISINNIQLLSQLLRLQPLKWSDTNPEQQRQQTIRSMQEGLVHAVNTLLAPVNEHTSPDDSVPSVEKVQPLPDQLPTDLNEEGIDIGYSQYSIASAFAEYDKVDAQASVTQNAMRNTLGTSGSQGIDNVPVITFTDVETKRMRNIHEIVAATVNGSVKTLAEEQEAERMRLLALQDSNRKRLEEEAKQQAAEEAARMEEKLRDAMRPTVLVRKENVENGNKVNPRSFKYRLDMYDMYPPQVEAPPQTPAATPTVEEIEEVEDDEEQRDAVRRRLNELREELATPVEEIAHREHILKLIEPPEEAPMTEPTLGDVFGQRAATQLSSSQPSNVSSPILSQQSSRRASLTGQLSMVLATVDDAMVEIERELEQRRRFADMNFCATRIQTIWRGFHQRILYAIKVRVENKAAQRIQSNYRGYLYRKRVGTLLQLRRAAVKMESWWRMVIARKRMRLFKEHIRMMKSKHLSATAFQSIVRGLIARRRVTGIRRVETLIQKVTRVAAGLHAFKFAQLGDLLVNLFLQISTENSESGVLRDGSIKFAILPDPLRPVILVMQAVLTVVAPLAWRVRGINPTRRMIVDPLGTMVEIVKAQGGPNLSTAAQKNAAALPGIDVTCHVNPTLSPALAAAQAAAVPALLPAHTIGPVFAEEKGEWVLFRIHSLTDIAAETGGLLLAPTSLAAAAGCLLDTAVQRLSVNLAALSRIKPDTNIETTDLPNDAKRLAQYLPPELRATVLLLLTWVMLICRIAELTPSCLASHRLLSTYEKMTVASAKVQAIAAKKFNIIGDSTIPAYHLLGLRPWVLRPRPVVVVISYDTPSSIAEYVISSLERDGGSSFILVDPEAELGGTPSSQSAVAKGLMYGQNVHDMVTELGQGRTHNDHPVKNANYHNSVTTNRYRGNAGAYRRRMLLRLHTVLSGGHNAIMRVALGAAAFSRERFVRDMRELGLILQPHISSPVIILVSGIGISMSTGTLRDNLSHPAIDNALPTETTVQRNDLNNNSVTVENSVLSMPTDEQQLSVPPNVSAPAETKYSTPQKPLPTTTPSLDSTVIDPLVDIFTNEPAALTKPSYLLADDATSVDEIGRAVIFTTMENLEGKRHIPVEVQRTITNTWAAPQIVPSGTEPVQSFVNNDIGKTEPKIIYQHIGPISLNDLLMQARIAQLSDAVSLACTQRAAAISSAILSTVSNDRYLDSLLLTLPTDKAHAVFQAVQASESKQVGIDGVPQNISAFDATVRSCTGLTLNQVTAEKASGTVGFHYSMQADLSSCATSHNNREIEDVCCVLASLMSVAATNARRASMAHEFILEGDDATTAKASTSTVSKVSKSGDKNKVVFGAKKEKVGPVRGAFVSGVNVEMSSITRPVAWDLGRRLLTLSPSKLAGRLAAAIPRLTQDATGSLRKYMIWMEQLEIVWSRAAVGNSPLSTSSIYPDAPVNTLGVRKRLVANSPVMTLLANWCTNVVMHLLCIHTQNGPARPLTGPQLMVDIDEDFRKVTTEVHDSPFTSIIYVAAKASLGVLDGIHTASIFERFAQAKRKLDPSVDMSEPSHHLVVPSSVAPPRIKPLSIQQLNEQNILKQQEQKYGTTAIETRLANTLLHYSPLPYFDENASSHLVPNKSLYRRSPSPTMADGPPSPPHLLDGGDSMSVLPESAPYITVAYGPNDCFSQVLACHLLDIRVHAQDADVPIEFISNAITQHSHSSSSIENGIDESISVQPQATITISTRTSIPSNKLLSANFSSTSTDSHLVPSALSPSRLGDNLEYNSLNTSPLGWQSVRTTSPSHSHSSEAMYSVTSMYPPSNDKGDAFVYGSRVSIYRDSGRIILFTADPQTATLRWSAMPDDPFLLADLAAAGAIRLREVGTGLSGSERERLREKDQERRRKGDIRIRSWGGLTPMLRLQLPCILTPPPDFLANRPFLEPSTRMLIRPGILPLFTTVRAIPCLWKTDPNNANASNGSLVLASISVFAEAGVGICTGVYRARTLLFRVTIARSLINVSTVMDLRVSAADVSMFLSLLSPASVEGMLLRSHHATPLDVALCLLDRLNLYELDASVSASTTTNVSASASPMTVPFRSETPGHDIYSPNSGDTLVKSENRLLLHLASKNSLTSGAPKAVVSSVTNTGAIFQPKAAVSTLISPANEALKESLNYAFLPALTTITRTEQPINPYDVPTKTAAMLLNPSNLSGAALINSLANNPPPPPAVLQTYTPAFAAGRALSRSVISTKGSLAICTSLSDTLPASVHVRGTTQASAGRPVAVACPIAPSPDILRTGITTDDPIARTSALESFPVNNNSKTNNASSTPSSGKTTTQLGLRINAGGMGGQLLGTAVVAVQYPPKLQSDRKTPSSKTKPSTFNLADKPLSVRVTVFEPTWAPDPIINRDRLAAAPSAGVSATSAHADATDNTAIDPQQQGNAPPPGTWTNITTRMKAKTLDGINEYARLIVVVDGLGPIDQSIIDNTRSIITNKLLSSIPENTEAKPTENPHSQSNHRALLKAVERGEAKFISQEEALQVYSDLTRLLLPDSVVFEIQPFERIALLGGNNAKLPLLSTHIRPEEQLQAFAKTRYMLVSTIASRIQASLISPSTVVDRAADSSPLLLRSLVSSTADAAVDVLFDRTLNRNTVKTGFGRSVYAAVRLLEHPTTYLQQFPLRNTDAMTAYTLAAAKISIAGQPKRKIKPTIHDGLQLLIWDNDTPYRTQIGTITINTNDLRNMLRNVREDAEKKAFVDNKGKPIGSSKSVPSSSTPSTNNSRSTTPTTSNRNATPNSRRNNIDPKSGSTSDTVTSNGKPYEQYLNLVVNWPRNLDDLSNDPVHIYSWLSNNMTNIYEAVPDNITSYVPSSLITQTSAVLSNVPNLLSDKDDE